MHTLERLTDQVKLSRQILRLETKFGFYYAILWRSTLGLQEVWLFSHQWANRLCGFWTEPLYTLPNSWHVPCDSSETLPHILNSWWPTQPPLVKLEDRDEYAFEDIMNLKKIRWQIQYPVFWKDILRFKILGWDTNTSTKLAIASSFWSRIFINNWSTTLWSSSPLLLIVNYNLHIWTFRD